MRNHTAVSLISLYGRDLSPGGGTQPLMTVSLFTHFAAISSRASAIEKPANVPFDSKYPFTIYLEGTFSLVQQPRRPR